MARQVLPIVGAVIGAFYGNPQAGYMIGSLVGNAIDPQVIKGPSLGDGQAQTSKEGVVRPIIFGTACCGGNIIATGPLIKKTEEQSGGKGGPVTEVEKFYRTYAIRICEGPIGALLRIWEDETLKYDIRPEDSQVEDDENVKFLRNFVLYLGGEDQMPDSALESVFGVGNTPAYRGSAYIVFENYDLTNRMGSIPNYRFEVSIGGNSRVYPENRVDSLPYGGGRGIPGVTLGSYQILNGTKNRPVVYTKGYHNNTITDWKSFDGIFRIRAKQNSPSSQPYMPGNTGGWIPSRLRLVSPSEEVTYWSSGWLCHPSQTTWLDQALSTEGFTQYKDFFTTVKRTNSGPNTPYDIESEVRLSKDIETRYVIDQIYISDSNLISTSAYTYFNTDIPDPEKLPSGNLVPHPEYPAALYNSSTKQTIWLSWADQYYDIIAYGKPTKLGLILNDLVDRCGVSLNKIETSQIFDTDVNGLVLAQQYTAKSAIESLQQCFFFDPSEYNNKINFVKRGNDVEQIFEEDDFVEDSVEANRKSSIEYPKKLNLIYQNAKIGYDTAKAEARRNSPNFQVSGEKTFELPVVFKEDEAAQVVDKQMKVAWAEAAGEYKFVLPSQYDYLVPSDVFGVYINNSSNRLRIESIERADGQLSITAKIDRQSAYTSNVKALPLPEPTPPPPTIAGKTIFEYLNIPALLDSNDVLGYYIAATGQTQAWSGAAIQRKHAGIDEDYQRIDNFTGLNTIGRLIEPLNDASEHYSDTTNVIHLQLYNIDGSFETVTQDFLLRENNAIAIPMSDGTAEIIQFRDVESIGNGEYKLSYLLRGRLNTVTSSHESGKSVVWLKHANMIVTDAMEMGTTFNHRAISYGEQVEDATVYTNPFITPYMQLEWPVDLFRGMRMGSDIFLEWSPRERFGSDLMPVRSVNWDGYEVVVNNGSYTQSFLTNEPMLNETMLFDLPVSATVYQLNRYTGRGPGVTINLE